MKMLNMSAIGKENIIANIKVVIGLSLKNIKKESFPTHQ